MKTRHIVMFVFALLTGCGSVPLKEKPGATIRGQDLPVVERGAMAAEDTPPVPMYMKNPDYPVALKKAGFTGTVIVEFIVGSDGKVKEAHAVSSPHPELSELVVAAILQSEYKPAMKAGKLVNVRLRTGFSFSLGN